MSPKTDLRKSQRRLVAVVVTYNRLDKLKDTIFRLLESSEDELSALVVVDNASTDGTADWLTRQTEPRLDVLLSEINRGGVREGHTVTHAALQIAYFMGFRQVVIIGMDHNFTQSGPPNAELEMRGADPNHFSPDYFRGNKWDAPNLAESEISYRAALAAFSAAGRDIVDATDGGHCQVFPKEDYRSFFGLKD